MNSFSGRMAGQNGEGSERELRSERAPTWTEVAGSGGRPRAGKGLSQPSPGPKQNEEGSSLLSAADTTANSFSKTKKREREMQCERAPTWAGVVASGGHSRAEEGLSQPPLAQKQSEEGNSSLRAAKSKTESSSKMKKRNAADAQAAEAEQEKQAEPTSQDSQTLKQQKRQQRRERQQQQDSVDASYAGDQAEGNSEAEALAAEAQQLKQSALKQIRARRAEDGTHQANATQSTTTRSPQNPTPQEASASSRKPGYLAEGAKEGEPAGPPAAAIGEEGQERAPAPLPAKKGGKAKSAVRVSSNKAAGGAVGNPPPTKPAKRSKRNEATDNQRVLVNEGNQLGLGGGVSNKKRKPTVIGSNQPSGNGPTGGGVGEQEDDHSRHEGGHHDYVPESHCESIQLLANQSSSASKKKKSGGEHSKNQSGLGGSVKGRKEKSTGEGDGHHLHRKSHLSSECDLDQAL